MTSLRLILEHAPTPQAVTEMAYHGGDISVGRGEDADWRVIDPDSFVSRKHFVLSTDGERVLVTDASRGGLFVDGSQTPLGLGNSVAAEDAMRLRFGDFVARIEIVHDAAQGRPAASPAKPSAFDFSFDPIVETAPPPERPDDLPEPFGKPKSPFFNTPDEERAPPEPIDRDDPFALGLKPTEREPPSRRDPSTDGGGYFNESPGASAPKAAPAPKAEAKPALNEPAPSVAHDSDLRAAFYRGLGLDQKDIRAGDPAAEMEALGKRFRAMTEGIMHLLQTRAKEKDRIRVARTIVGAQDVNLLKFAGSAEAAVRSVVSEQGDGYLGPDDCITEAFRDLMDHQVRTWSALQTALRRMTHKFDPEVIEKELSETGLLETLMAGGKNAKLWQLYEERYEELARAAEERFLGEIGAEFRDAYERK